MEKQKFEEKVIEGKKTKVIINADAGFVEPDRGAPDKKPKKVRTPKKK